MTTPANADSLPAGGEYIDSHCHLYFDRFDEDREEVIQRAKDAGFIHVINIGTDLNTSRACLDLAAQYPGFCYATVGLHPTDTAMSEVELAEVIAGLEVMLDEAPAVIRGIGETGLDYYWDKATPEEQHRAFHAQMQLAEARQLPIVIHCRDAMEDTLRVVTEYRDRVTGVFHCYGGDANQVEEVLALGWYVSFAGNVSYPKAQELRDAALKVPRDRLLLETDAPFLAPQTKRGKRNEPLYALGTLAALAEVHGVSSIELGRDTTENTRRLFSIPAAH